MSLSDAFLNLAQLGGEWVLWLLLGLSVTSSAIVFERGWLFWKRRCDPEELARQIVQCLRAADPLKARASLLRNSTAEGLVIAAGITRLEQGALTASEAMHSVRSRERLRMQGNLPILDAIASAAMQLGWLGALLGLAGVLVQQATGDAVEASELTGPLLLGFAQALVTAAVGLLVGIPARAAVKVFQHRVRTTLTQIDSLMSLLLAHLPTAAETSAEVTPAAKAA